MPDSRKGKLDAGLLATMVITHSRMENIDAHEFGVLRSKPECEMEILEPSFLLALL